MFIEVFLSVNSEHNEHTKIVGIRIPSICWSNSSKLNTYMKAAYEMKVRCVINKQLFKQCR